MCECGVRDECAQSSIQLINMMADVTTAPTAVVQNGVAVNHQGQHSWRLSVKVNYIRSDREPFSMSKG
eukprot:5461561-Amphidinium_carterae.1